MTEQQKANLLQLATYLLSDDLKARFDMQWFTELEGETQEDYMFECGTIGCAAGHGPYAGMPKFKNEDWASYIHRVFGISNRSRAFLFIFGAGWTSVDNTPQGAAKRILFFLREGEEYISRTFRYTIEMVAAYSKEAL